MARRNNSRAAQGAGSIRQRPDGRWEARFTYQDDLGRTKRASIYAPTQKECRQKLTAALRNVDSGQYRQTKRYSVAQWLEEWLTTYCIDLKPLTRSGYQSKINSRIIPYLGEVQLTSLTNVQIQRYYNRLQENAEGKKALSPKTIQNLHGILHKALDQAVAAGLIVSNPADHIKLPKVKKPALRPLMDENIGRFLSAIQGDPFERVYIVTLFSGMRLSEIVGLRWEDVDLDAGIITVHRQLQKDPNGGYLLLDETKNGKARTASIAPSVSTILRQQKAQQAEWKLAAGQLWTNADGLVFTDPLGEHLKHTTLQHHFKKIVASIGMPETRFHDLRHSYAVNALQAGDSPKVVQEQLGHYSTAFTMDCYAAVSETMRADSQARMEAFIQSVQSCKG